MRFSVHTASPIRPNLVFGTDTSADERENREAKGREHRKVVEHGSEFGTSIAPELFNHRLYLGFLWDVSGHS
jgi:hypothetical protein